MNHLNPIIAGDGPMPLGYEVKFETVRGNGADLRMRSLLDRQQFHDPAGEAEQAGISSALWPLFGWRAMPMNCTLRWSQPCVST